MYTAYFEPEYSGAALQALTLARELRRRGHHVEFVTNRWPGLSDTAVVDGFAVRRLEPGRLRKHREFRLWFNLARYVWARRQRLRHPAQPRRLFHPRLHRAAGPPAGPEVAGQGQPGQRRPAGPVAPDRRHAAPVHAAPHRRLRGHQPGPGRGVPRRRHAPAERIHHLPNGVDTERFRRAAGATGAGAARRPGAARGPADRAVRGRAGPAQEHPLAGRAMGGARRLRHRRAAAGRRPAGARRPAGRAARPAGRTGPRAPAALRAARLPRRRGALLPVRRPAGAALVQGRAAQRGAGGHGLRPALRGRARQRQPRTDRRRRDRLHLRPGRRRRPGRGGAALPVARRRRHGRRRPGSWRRSAIRSAPSPTGTRPCTRSCCRGQRDERRCRC